MSGKFCVTALSLISDEFVRFLGPRMIYTSGIINNLTREESLEELQDNKLTVVCEKVEPIVISPDA